MYMYMYIHVHVHVYTMYQYRAMCPDIQQCVPIYNNTSQNTSQYTAIRPNIQQYVPHSGALIQGWLQSATPQSGHLDEQKHPVLCKSRPQIIKEVFGAANCAQKDPSPLTGVSLHAYIGSGDPDM